MGTAIAAVSEQADARHRNREHATVAAAAISDNLAGVATALSGVNGLAVDGTVESDEFRAFATNVVAASALETLADVVVVPDAERAAFEAELGRPITERTAQGGFAPAARRDRYAAVVDVTPATDNSAALIGFDILSDPVRARAAGTATNIRGFVLSEPVPLAPSGRTGYFLIQPVFTPTGELIGYMSTGLLAEDLVDAARQRLPAEAAVGLREGDVVIAPTPSGADAVTVEAAGRRWIVSVDDGTPADRSLTIVVLVATVLLALLLGLLATRERRFDRARQAFASRLTEDARRAERLAEVGRRLSVARHLDTVVAVIERDVPRVFDADFADIGLLLDNSLSMLGTPDGGIDVELFNRYRRVNLDQHLLTTQAVRDAEPVLVEDLLAYQSGHPGLYDDVLASGLRSAAALPLFDAEGRVFAVIGIGWRAPQRFPATVTALLRTVGDLCGQTLDRARDTDRQHQFVAALQRRLLPVPPERDDLEIVARYRSATATMGMGGDWYQFVPMPDGSVVIVVGDVIGHGVDAIAVMTQIQHVTPAVLQMGVPLAEVFNHIDTALGPAMGAHASALILHVDPAGRRVHYVSAGHPYSLLRTPDGRVTELRAAQYALVGLQSEPRSLASVDFPPGSMLLAYTDGLIERRNRPLTTGIELLAEDFQRRACADGPVQLDRLVEQLIEDTLSVPGSDGSVDDDVAVVLIRNSIEQ
jgi:hypothetical protein